MFWWANLGIITFSEPTFHNPICPLFGKILKETCTIYCFKMLFQNCPLVVPVSSHRLSRHSLSLGHQGALFWSWPPDERIPKKALFFPLPFSILAGTNLISYYFFFANPVWFPRKSTPIRFSGKFIPVWFPRKSILVWFPRKSILVWFPTKSMQNPQEKQKKKCFFFSSMCFLDLI